MLTELHVGGGARSAVFGAGINCFSGSLDAPEDVRASMDSLESVSRGGVSMNAACGIVAASALRGEPPKFYAAVEAFLVK